MKFRGIIYDSIALKEFYNVVCTLSKLSKECVLRITPTNLYFIMNDESFGMNKPVVWCHLTANYYFKEYSMEGVSPDQNEIYLEFATGLLLKSLAFLKACIKFLKIKLTNKATPCLTIEIEIPQGYQNQQCIHDIPVKVIPRRLWGEFEEPLDYSYHITIEMPSLKAIKNIVERLKSLSQHLIISATKSGRFSISIKTVLGDIAAHVPDLEVIEYSGPSNSGDDDEEERPIQTQVDIKKCHMYFASQHISCKKMYCSILENKLVKIYIENEAVNLQLFLPACSD